MDEQLVLVDQVQPVELGRELAAAEEHSGRGRVLELLHALAQIAGDVVAVGPREVRASTAPLLGLRLQRDRPLAHGRRCLLVATEIDTRPPLAYARGMYTLYYSPGTASMAVHLALLELGAPHELRRVDLKSGAHKDPEYLRLNPNGMVPTLVIDGAPTYECAAILLLLGERHPAAALAPAPRAPDRALYLQWMLHLANTLQPAFRQWFYPNDFGPAVQEAEMKAHARVRIEAVWDRLDAHLARRGPHILGAEVSIADLYATMLMRWSRNMPAPADRWPAIASLARAIKSRPSWKQLYEREELTEWL